MDSCLDMQCFGGMYFIPIQIASCRRVEVFKLSLYPFNSRTINNETCPVCLDHLDEALLMHLPCLHAYHSTCITPWSYVGSLCCPLYKTGFRDSPLLSYRLGLVMQNWSTYTHAIIVYLLKLGSQNQSSTETVVQASNSIDASQISVLWQTPGAYNWKINS